MAWEGAQGTSNATMVATAPYISEIGVRLLQIQLLDPRISVADVMPLTLEFEASRLIGDSFAAVVSAVDAGARAAPDLGDFKIGVGFFAVEIHRDYRPLGALVGFESRSAKDDVIGVPFSNAVV